MPKIGKHVWISHPTEISKNLRQTPLIRLTKKKILLLHVTQNLFGVSCKKLTPPTYAKKIVLFFFGDFQVCWRFLKYVNLLKKFVFLKTNEK